MPPQVDGAHGTNRIIDEHGGDIRVDSTVNRGTTVTVELPLTTL
ncbi:MAG: hypothetical protein GF341_09005 [candidate division Zixibacteria bacterium]|nr:hypothetical protein [candidate division Zixibacteria bacterium]